MRRNEEGSFSVELVVLAPVLVLLVAFVVILGRVSLAKGQVTDAARAGAQAGAASASGDQAQSAAAQAVSSTLTGEHLTCAQLGVLADAAGFRPGGSISVQVACTVSDAQVALPGLPGSQTLHAQVTAPIDPFRRVGP